MKNKLNNSDIKKYPVFYQGEEYEIRIELEKIYSVLGFYLGRYIVIYKVTKSPSRFFNKKQDKIKLKYKKVCSVILDNIEREINKICPTDENYYIELFKYAFKRYISERDKEIAAKNIENKKLKALEKWDGVIE